MVVLIFGSSQLFCQQQPKGVIKNELHNVWCGNSYAVLRKLERQGEVEWSYKYY